MKWKWQKILHEFSTFQKYSKYWSVLLEHFIKHKPFISKRVTFLKNVLNCGSQAILWQKEFEDWIVWRLHAFNIVITTYVFQVFSLIFKQQENNSLCCSNCNFSTQYTKTRTKYIWRLPLYWKFAYFMHETKKINGKSTFVISKL